MLPLVACLCIDSLKKMNSGSIMDLYKWMTSAVYEYFYFAF